MDGDCLLELLSERVTPACAQVSLAKVSCKAALKSGRGDKHSVHAWLKGTSYLLMAVMTTTVSVAGREGDKDGVGVWVAEEK